MRIFLAIDFPEQHKREMLQTINVLRQEFPDFKWVKKPALHLTIKFIGEVQHSMVAQISDQLGDPLGRVSTFDLKTTQSGFFPSVHNARVFFLDIQRSPVLDECFDIIENKLNALHIGKETRRFHPHITLARIKNRSLLPEESGLLLAAKMPSMIIPVPEIILMQSELLPGGARYTPVQRFTLRAR